IKLINRMNINIAPLILTDNMATKGDGKNKATTNAKLTINVNSVRKTMRDYYSTLETNSKSTQKSKKDDKKETGITATQVSSVAVTALLEKITELIIKDCTRRVTKNNMDIREVN